MSFGEVLLAQKYPKLGDLSHGPQTPTGDQRERFSLWKPFRQSGADWESRKRQHRDFERAEFAPNFPIFFKNMRKKQPFSNRKRLFLLLYYVSILCFLLKQNHIRFSGFRHSSSGSTKRPSLRMSTSSNQISPPPYSGVIISTKSQWIADLLPLGASS